MLHLYGLAEAPLRLPFQVYGVPDENGRPAPVSVVATKGCAILVSEGGGPLPGDPRHPAVTARLIGHQRALEDVMRRALIVPFKFGSWVSDNYEVRQLAEAGESLLMPTFRDFAGLCEVSLHVSWDAANEVKRLAASASLAPLRARAEATGAMEDRAAVGRHLQGLLLAERATVAQRILAVVRPLGTEAVVDEPLLDAIVLGVHLLVRRSQQALIEEAVDALDEEFGGRLHFRLLAGQPPHHYRCANAERFPAEALTAAGAVLGLRGIASRAQVREAYRKLLFLHHPDANPKADRAVLPQVEKAYNVLWQALGTQAELPLTEPAVALHLWQGVNDPRLVAVATSQRSA